MKLIVIFLIGLIVLSGCLTDWDIDFGTEQCKRNGYDQATKIHRSTDGNYIYAITCEIKIEREEWK